MSWLTSVTERFVHSLEQNRLPHAVLITGERGVGKRTLAESLAAVLVCESRSEGSISPCGQCRQCQLVEGASHPDIRVYAPEKSRMIRVDQVRALSQFAVASPQVARLKVVIVDRTDQLNINAANALLKTLEEPASDVVLLLLQESGRPVLPTIRSRCQIVPLAIPRREQAESWLASRVDGSVDGRSAERVDLALNLAGGAPRLALDYLEGDFLEQRERALEAFRQFMKGGISVASAAKAFRDLGHEAILNLMENWVNDLARVVAGGQARDPGIAEVVRYLAASCPPWRAQELADQIRESRRAMVNNVNVELETDRLLIQWRSLMPTRRRRRAG